jgi:hypothetical protein
MQNPRFEKFSLQNQEISPKLTLKIPSSEAAFGQKLPLRINSLTSAFGTKQNLGPN